MHRELHFRAWGPVQLTVARDDGVQVLDVRVQGVPKGLIFASRGGLRSSLCGTRAENISCIQFESMDELNGKGSIG